MDRLTFHTIYEDAVYGPDIYMAHTPDITYVVYLDSDGETWRGYAFRVSWTPTIIAERGFDEYDPDDEDAWDRLFEALKQACERDYAQQVAEAPFITVFFGIEYTVPREHEAWASRQLASDIAQLTGANYRKVFDYLHIDPAPGATWEDVSFEWMRPDYDKEEA